MSSFFVDSKKVRHELHIKFVSLILNTSRYLIGVLTNTTRPGDFKYTLRLCNKVYFSVCFCECVE